MEEDEEYIEEYDGLSFNVTYQLRNRGFSMTQEPNVDQVKNGMLLRFTKGDCDFFIMNDRNFKIYYKNELIDYIDTKGIQIKIVPIIEELGIMISRDEKIENYQIR